MMLNNSSISNNINNSNNDNNNDEYQNMNNHNASDDSFYSLYLEFAEKSEEIIKSKKKKVQDLENKILSLENSNNKLKQNNEKLKQELAKSKTLTDSKERTIIELTASIKSIESEKLKQADDEKENLNLHDEILNLKQELNKANTIINNLNEQIDTYSKSLSEYSNKVSSLTVENIGIDIHVENRDDNDENEDQDDEDETNEEIRVVEQETSRKMQSSLNVLAKPLIRRSPRLNTKSNSLTQIAIESNYLPSLSTKASKSKHNTTKKMARKASNEEINTDEDESIVTAKTDERNAARVSKKKNKVSSSSNASNDLEITPTLEEPAATGKIVKSKSSLISKSYKAKETLKKPMEEEDYENHDPNNNEIDAGAKKIRKKRAL